MVRRTGTEAEVSMQGVGRLLNGSSRGRVEDEDKVDGGDGNEVWGIEEAEFGAVGIVDDKPGDTCERL